MFRSAKMLTLMALSTAAGVVSVSPRSAEAQVYIERVYDVGCDVRCYDFAGTLTIDHRSFRISTRGSILDQIEEAFLCRGYDVCRVGRTVRVYKDCGSPDICFDSGLYDLRLRENSRYVSISLVRCSVSDACDFGSHRDGVCYRHDTRGVEFGIRLDFGNHDFELYHHDDHHDRGYDRHDHDDRRDSHRDDRDDRHDNRGRDDWRDGDDDRGHRGNAGERSGGRTYVTPERRLDRPDEPARTPRAITPTPGAEQTKKPISDKADETPVRRGNKLTSPPKDDLSSQPGTDTRQPRADQRERVIVREPETVNARPRDRSGSIIGNGGSKSNEKALPKPLPVQSPDQTKPRSNVGAKTVTKEPSRSPASAKPAAPASNDKPRAAQTEKKDDKKDDKASNQKKDRRW